MNHRTVSKIARILGIGGFAVVVAACAAPVENEAKGVSEEAEEVGCKNDNPYVKCPSAGDFTESPLEQGLAALGCSGKMVTDGDGPGGKAMYQTTCAVNATATFPCGERCQLIRGAGRRIVEVCTPVTVTGGVNQLVACQGGSVSGSSSCGCSLPAPYGKVYVSWDPTCSSGSCMPVFQVN